MITSTQSDLASAICGAVGALKGRLHGGAPSEVRDQLTQIGDVEHAEQWIRQALARGERLMGFGHRVYKTMDPRARALRGVAERLAADAEWLKLAIDVEDVALRLLAEHKPDRPLKTNVEYYASIVLDGVGLMTDLYTPAFAVARTAGWCAHALEQAEHGRLIRPDALYVGPDERPLPVIAPGLRTQPGNPDHVGRPARRPATAAAPRAAARRRPARTADRPSHRIGATAGSASRLAGTDIGASRPKCHQAIGAVASVQATEIATAWATVPCTRGATSMIAATAAKLSWNPGSYRLSGLTARTTTAPQATRCQRATGRDASHAASVSPPATPARTIDGPAPAIST